MRNSCEFWTAQTTVLSVYLKKALIIKIGTIALKNVIIIHRKVNECTKRHSVSIHDIKQRLDEEVFKRGRLEFCYHLL